MCFISPLKSLVGHVAADDSIKSGKQVPPVTPSLIPILLSSNIS